MKGMADHAKPPRNDHLWVLFVIAACALVELVASWVTIGAVSGFPRIGGKLPTDWTLAVATEAYWGYALYSWLAGAPGHRSRRFAMWSAAGVFVLSLAGQGSAHLVRPGTVPSPVLVVFITSLPVITLALIAILVHLRQLDREDAEREAKRAAAADRQAAIERAEADERTALRAALADAEAVVEPLRSELEAARGELARMTAKTEMLERKLDVVSRRGKSRNARAKNGAGSPRSKGTRSHETEVPNDVDARAEAMAILDTEPGISGAELGERVGKSKRWGQLLKSSLASASAPTDIVDGGDSRQE